MIRRLLRLIGIKSSADKAEDDIRDLARDLIASGAISATNWQYISDKIDECRRDSEERSVRLIAATIVLARCSKRLNADLEHLN